MAGARGRIGAVGPLLLAARETGARTGAELALVRASIVYGPEHIESAVRHAIRAFEEATNISDSFAGEVLCYVCGERQVNAALKKAGVREGDDAVIVVASGPAPDGAIGEFLAVAGLARDDDVVSRQDKDLVAILKTLALKVPVGLEGRESELILEKVALLDIYK